MKKSMQRFAALPLMLATLSTGVFYPIHQAEALVGILTANLPAIVVGGLMTAVGGGDVLYVRYGDQNPNFDTIMFVLGTLILLPAGLIVLDAQNGQQVNFNELQPEDQARLGLTDAEFQAYNLEGVRELRLKDIADEAASAAAAAPQGQEQAASAAKWSAELATMSPDAQSALHKMFAKKN